MIRTQRSLWFYTLSNRGIIWKGSKISIYSHHITDFNVAGMRYWDGALVLDELKVGINLTMIVEENNPNDPDAVALYWKDAKIGYIPPRLKLTSGFATPFWTQRRIGMPHP